VSLCKPPCSIPVGGLAGFNPQVEYRAIMPFKEGGSPMTLIEKLRKIRAERKISRMEAAASIREMEATLAPLLVVGVKPNGCVKVTR